MTLLLVTSTAKDRITAMSRLRSPYPRRSFWRISSANEQKERPLYKARRPSSSTKIQNKTQDEISTARFLALSLSDFRGSCPLQSVMTLTLSDVVSISFRRWCNAWVQRFIVAKRRSRLMCSVMHSVQTSKRTTMAKI